MMDVLFKNCNYILLCVLYLLINTEISSAINCYRCSSFNGSDVNCEDPFNPAMSTYAEKCMVPKKGHIGEFPANFCIKIRGTHAETNQLMVIRACVMRTMDSQCGEFRYEEKTMTGCILTCDYDGCNSANYIKNNPILIMAFILYIHSWIILL